MLKDSAMMEQGQLVFQTHLNVQVAIKMTDKEFVF